MTKTLTKTLLPSSAPDTPTSRKPDRFWADFLCYWRLCDQGSCRRARACGGDDLASCISTHYPQLPQDVRAWLRQLRAETRAGASLDETLARLEASGLTRALNEWRGVPLPRAKRPGAADAAAPIRARAAARIRAHAV